MAGTTVPSLTDFTALQKVVTDSNTNVVAKLTSFAATQDTATTAVNDLEATAQTLFDAVRLQNGTLDPAKTDIKLDELRAFTGRPIEADEVPWIIPFYPPVNRTEEALIYVISNAKKLRIDVYAFGNPKIADAIVARIRESKTAGGRPFDYKVMSNHDCYISWPDQVKAPGNPLDTIDAKLSTGAWKYPEFHNNPNFILSSSEYRLSETTFGVDGSRRIDHRKMGVADDVLMWTGSTNYGDSDNNKQAQELHFIAQPGVVRRALEAFDTTWQGNLDRGPAFYNIK